MRSIACDGPCIFTLEVMGSGAGTVTSNPPAIACRADCSTTVFSPALPVSLEALPDAGSWVSGWVGCTPLIPTRCTATMPLGDLHVIVVFDRIGGPTTPPPDMGPSDSAPSPPTASPPTGQLRGCTIVGTPGDDELLGTPARDVLCGLGGDDHIHSGGGPDVLRGGPGADELEGQAGADRFFGGEGRDVLIGGSGADRLEGGGARDVLRSGADSDVVLARDGIRDRVHGGPGRDRARVDRRDVVAAIEQRF